jgi:hypothetical protein
MRIYEKCKMCGCWHWGDNQCGNEYTIYHNDCLAKEGMKMYGVTFMDVARRYAAWYNNGGGALTGNSVAIEVEGKYGMRKKFRISAKVEILYYAVEI